MYVIVHMYQTNTKTKQEVTDMTLSVTYTKTFTEDGGIWTGADYKVFDNLKDAYAFYTSIEGDKNQGLWQGEAWHPGAIQLH